jgi:hypothetical protein
MIVIFAGSTGHVAVQDAAVTIAHGTRPVTTLRKKIEPEPERPRYLAALRELGDRFESQGVTDA